MTLISKFNNRLPEMNPLFNHLIGRDLIMEPDHFFNYNSQKPSVNILETDDSYLLEVAAPGYLKDEFKIEVDKNILTISATKEEAKEETGKYTRREFRNTSFSRSFTLPENKFDDTKIEASYEAGILQVNIFKKEEAKPKPKRMITIA